MDSHEVHSTIKVCQDCMLAHANGEYDPDRVEREKAGEQPQVWSAIPEGWQVTMGMGYEEHSCGRENGEDVDECECENYGFSWSSCDGCEDGFGGDRYWFTLWSPVEPEPEHVTEHGVEVVEGP